MSTEETKKVSYEIAVEHLKQHHFLSNIKSNIPQIINYFNEIYENIDNESTYSNETKFDKIQNPF